MIDLAALQQDITTLTPFAATLAGLVVCCAFPATILATLT